MRKCIHKQAVRVERLVLFMAQLFDTSRTLYESVVPSDRTSSISLEKYYRRFGSYSTKRFLKTG